GQRGHQGRSGAGWPRRGPRREGSVIAADCSVDVKHGRRRGLPGVGAVESDAEVPSVGGDGGAPAGGGEGDSLAALRPGAIPATLHGLTRREGEGERPWADGAGALVGQGDRSAEATWPAAVHRVVHGAGTV